MANIADINPTSASYFGITPAQPKEGLNMQKFLELLAVQMQNQNPLEPMNDRDFFAQMAQLGQVQGLDEVNNKLTINQAAELMGRQVTAVRPMTETSSGQPELVSGTVKQLTVKEGKYYLGIQEANGGIVEVEMSSIQQIRD
jgi:flagellar basal-body rod modification protein FlgD